MEAEERPLKMRKLDQDSAESSHLALPVDSSANGIEQAVDERHAAEDGVSSNDAHPSVHIVGTESSHVDENHSSVMEPLPSAETFAQLVQHQTVEDAPLTKSQQKKLRKKQEWESKREERKAIRKEKTVAKRERKREARKQEAAAHGEGDPDDDSKTKKALPLKHEQLPITIMIDCGFDDLMRDKERISLAAQITRSYSDNRKAIFRGRLVICSFSGELRKRFENVLTHHKQWKGVLWLDEDFVEGGETARKRMCDPTSGDKLAGAFSKYADLDADAQTKLQNDGEIVYLSSEAEETITELKPYSTYIIGGLVDKNREKGICYKRATKAGIRTAKLPIGDYLEMASRKVLATNHVNEILIRWLECGDWGEAFMKVIPKRKGGKLRDTVSHDEGGTPDEDFVGEDRSCSELVHEDCHPNDKGNINTEVEPAHPTCVAADDSSV